MKQRGFVNIIVIIGIGIAILVGVTSYFVVIQLVPSLKPAPAPIACTMEAKLCPDGSAVGRTGPNCEFTPCPDINPTPTPVPDGEPVFCTQDAKQCPDGSYVGRTGPNCEFKCPTTTTGCTKDSDCPSAQYICQETQGTGTTCPSNDQSCVPTHTVIAGECKLKAGSRCNVDADCAGGNLCHNNICASPIGNQCSGPSDTSCPADYECVQGCGSPVGYPDEPPPPYFCQLKGYTRVCPICLAINTLIDTPIGAVPVQQLQPGAAVWTTNQSGQRIAGIVMTTGRTLVPSTHQMVELILADGRRLFVSPGHPTIDGRTVGELVAGDLYDGTRVVTAGRVTYGASATYDILPTGATGFYWANGILLDSTLK